MTDTEFKQEFSQRLKTLRKRAKLSQKKLGLKLGFSEKSAERMVQKWEYMEQLPQLMNIRTVSDALGCTLEELIP